MPSAGPYQVTFKPIVPRLDRPLIEPRILMRELDVVASRWAREFIDVIKTYPPPKKRGVYVRTGRLGASWRVAQDTNGDRHVTYVVNSVRDIHTGAYYMQRVQGMKQIPMHRRTGWINVWGAMRRFGSADFKNRTQQAINAHIARRRARAAAS